MHFRKENKPEGAPKRCLEGCPVELECPFHAGRYYLGEGRGWAKKFTEDHTNEGIIKALNETDYGKCVYQSDNNVVDHQVVNMEFEDGATATFSMSGFTREQTRMVQIMVQKVKFGVIWLRTKFLFTIFQVSRNPLLSLANQLAVMAAGIIILFVRSCMILIIMESRKAFPLLLLH